MSVKKVTMEFGPDHVIGRVEFMSGGKATVVGIDTGGEGGMVWSSDAEEAVEKQMAEEVVGCTFSAVLDAIVGEDQQQELVPSEPKGGDASGG